MAKAERGCAPATLEGDEVERILEGVEARLAPEQPALARGAIAIECGFAEKWARLVPHGR